MGAERFIRVFSLLYLMFATFHNKKVDKKKEYSKENVKKRMQTVLLGNRIITQ